MSYKNMKGPELVKTFNEMITQIGDKKGGEKFKPVKRFATAAAGVKRCEELAKFLKPPKANGAKKEGSGREDLDGFKVIRSSLRAKLIRAMLAAKGKQVPVPSLLSATYGSADVKNRSALALVMNGVRMMITKDKLPFELRKAKEGKETSFGLYPKS